MISGLHIQEVSKRNVRPRGTGAHRKQEGNLESDEEHATSSDTSDGSKRSITKV